MKYTNPIYRNREEAAESCKQEAAFAKRYSEAAIHCAAESMCSAAWHNADVAKIAATCAMQAHEALWGYTDGELTDYEFECFEAAEIAQTDAIKAARAAATAVQKLNAAKAAKR